MRVGVDQSGRRTASPRRASPPGEAGVLLSPATLLILALGIHLAGRIAAICCPFKVDSYTYAASAFRLYAPDATLSDLVPDKPPGQALLTGWVYRLLPGPPTRLALAPIESAFMLAGYFLFWRLATRLWGDRRGAWLTLLVVVAHNACNALDYTTDGFNLGENYSLLPISAAACAQIRCSAAWKRGLIRGVFLGLALSVKQSAAAMLAAFLVHDLYEAAVKRRPADSACRAGWTVIGLGLGFLPVVLFLLWQGWADAHLRDLLSYSGEHLRWMPLRLPALFSVQPLLPLAWWIAVGFGACVLARGHHAREPVCPAERSLAVFATVWLLFEAVLVWSMTKPAMHYYQQLVLPMALVAGWGVEGLRRAVAQDRPRGRRIWPWFQAITVALTIQAAAPLLAATVHRWGNFDYQAEVTGFQNWLDTRAPADAGIHAPGKDR